MDKRIFDFKDPRLDADSAARCALNVIVGTESCSLLAVGENGETRALTAWQFSNLKRDFKDSEADLRHVFGSETLFSYPFGRVRCAVFNLNATLVPRRLFDPHDLSAYFKILLSPAEYEYHFDELPESDCFLVYALEPFVKRTCEQYFPQGKMAHSAASLLKNLRHLARRDDYEVFANFRNQAVQVAVFDRQNLLFYNAFQFSKPNDALYFVLLAYDQFRLNSWETPLNVSGNLLEDSEVWRLLFRYVQHIKFVTLPESVFLPDSAESLPDHFWFDLAALAQSPTPNPP